MINKKTNSIFKLVFLASILLYFTGCKRSEPLILENKIITLPNSTDCKINNCAITEIEILEALHDNIVSKNINIEIQKAVCLALQIDDDNPPKSIDEAINRFNDLYQEMKKEFPDETTPYEASIHCQLSFRNDYILSILIDSYLFTGGAHGNGNSVYITLNTISGKLIDTTEIFQDYKKFKDIAEKIFRETYEIGTDASINSTGFFFENDQFILPENIGFTKSHILLVYNQYEISSYADGIIELKIDKKEVNSLFKINVL